MFDGLAKMEHFRCVSNLFSYIAPPTAKFAFSFAKTKGNRENAPHPFGCIFLVSLGFCE